MCCVGHRPRGGRDAVTFAPFFFEASRSTPTANAEGAGCRKMRPNDAPHPAPFRRRPPTRIRAPRHPPSACADGSLILNGPAPSAPPRGRRRACSTPRRRGAAPIYSYGTYILMAPIYLWLWHLYSYGTYIVMAPILMARYTYGPI